jgi:hypothetical protein
MTTAYHNETPESMRQLLERIRINKWRVRFHWGDTATGRDWCETYDTTGTLGRSMGPCKVPILLNNARSMGGGAILDHCIVKIEFANKRRGGVLYQHPNYHTGGEAA